MPNSEKDQNWAKKQWETAACSGIRSPQEWWEWQSKADHDPPKPLYLSGSRGVWERGYVQGGQQSVGSYRWQCRPGVCNQGQWGGGWRGSERMSLSFSPKDEEREHCVSGRGWEIWWRWCLIWAVTFPEKHRQPEMTFQGGILGNKDPSYPTLISC